ncbi:LptF/LptG family permease [Maioricimonas sp. JC845]|uniref:LptF/LptG family permease n=1 Tax=Maioricimonas sp. JC845 TaxID=3232138 RepID=UPI00345AB323
MWSFVPLLQRYIFGEIARIFVLILSCLTVLLIFVGVFQQASETGLGPMLLIRILPFIVASMLPFTIPAALLLTVSLVYGRIAGDQEVTAAKSAGINVLALMWPSFFLGGVLSVGSLLLTDQVIPWAVGNIERTVVLAMEDIFLSQLESDLQFSDPRRGIHIVVASVDDRRLIQPTIRYVRGDRVITMQAEEAQIQLDLNNQQAIVKLRHGYVDVPHGEQNHRVYFDDEVEQAISWESDLRQPKPRHLPIRAIRDEIKSIEHQSKRGDELRAVVSAMALTSGRFDALSEPGVITRREVRERERRFHKLETEIHSRYALACSCLFFVLLGSPFAILKAKSQFLTSFIFCFGPIVGGYYPLIVGLMAQAKRGNIDPLWSMWIGNILLGVAAWFAIRRVMRH